MVHIAADLPQFLQRRELAAYEQRLARTAYAYGVDLRRAEWLSGSTVGDPLMRAVDRRWSHLVEDLDKECLRPLRVSPPTALLEELANLIHMLRAPLPTVRLLRPEVAAQWPMVTPLGTTKGGIHWLVLDQQRLMALPADERTFVLASGLAHLQCEHGPIFAAHLMSHRGRGMGVGMIRRLLRPWAKVTVFSADRAGLVAVRELSVALRALERHHVEHAAWMPRLPALELRRQALEDFDRSSLMARRRVLSHDDGGGWAIAPPGREEELDSISRKMAAAVDGVIRLGGRLAFRLEGYERRARNDEAAPDQTPDQTPGQTPDQTKAKGAAEASDEPPKAKTKSKGDAKRAKAEDEASQPEATKAPPSDADSERASRLEHALRTAWSLARCDQRLTRRLGLL